MARPKGKVRPGGATGQVWEYTPLTPTEQKFVKVYIETGNVTTACKECGVELTSTDDSRYTNLGRDIFNRPNVQAEISRIMDEIRKDTVASATEVMKYLTDVMRGDVKDQFGLDASLSERTKAAQELAKRTIDIENRRAGEPDQTIAIKLDWSR